VCGRFALILGREEIAAHFELSELPGLVEPRYNISPGQEILTVVEDEGGERVGRFMRWGLVPSWARELSSGYRMINARAESLTERPAFRGPLRRQRCIIPATGFYEWKQTGADKKPYFIRSPEDEPLALAGLWERWWPPEVEDRSEVEPLYSCTIITVPAAGGVEGIHHRMPAVLPREVWESWLSPRNQAVEELREMLLSLPQRVELLAYPVSRRVNRADVEGPELIVPQEERPGDLFSGQ